MPDKRTVDELSIEELERILAIRKRQARQEQLQRMQRTGRVVQQPVQTIPAQRIGAEAPPENTPILPANYASPPQFEEVVLPQEFIKRKNDDAGVWRRFVDRSLLLVEIFAVMGLVFLGVGLLQGIGKLEQETSDAQQRAEEMIRAGIPTIAPTPVMQLADIVLPGGHTADGQFNFEEIPVSLRDQVRDQVYVPLNYQRPAVTSETARRLVIPDIGVDQAIVQGTDEEALKLGVGQMLNGVTPGDNGNVVLYAHNDIYGQIFRHLDELEPGMLFEIHTEKQIYTYIITGRDIVNPSDVHVLENRGHPTTTLISCYPYQVNNKRIVVYADRVDT
jgi:sortase A